MQPFRSLTGLIGLTAILCLVYPVLPAHGQLTKSDIARLAAREDSASWTFTIGENSATKRSLKNLTGLIIPKDWEKSVPQSAEKAFPPSTPVPAYMDWRAMDGVTPVRDQGDCGSCWAFAAMGAVESSILIHRGTPVDLSEQWLVSCTAAGNCGGGWYGTAFDHMVATNDTCDMSGAPLEEAFPYQAANAECTCPSERPYTLLSWGSTTSDITEIKQKILEYGPVAVGVAVDEVFQSYLSGVYNAEATTGINHAVTLVGWDDAQGTAGVWFLRNSWGEGWGENGYMRIEYGCAGVGTAPAYVEFTSEGDPNTINVPADYPTIGAALAAAGDGYVIVVQPGVYTGSGNVDLSFQGKAVTICSVNPSDPCTVAATIINCGGSSTSPHCAFTFSSGETSSSVLWGLTITNGYTNMTHGGGVSCSYSSPTIRDCVFTNNQARGYGNDGGGIGCYNSSPVIVGCTISGNSASYYGGGISCTDGSSPIISNCTITDNSAGSNGGGIYCWVNSCPEITNCLIANNTCSDVGGGLYFYECTASEPNSPDPNMINCTISGNTSTNMGGGVFGHNSRMGLGSSILWNNSSADGPEIALFDNRLRGTILKVTYSDIKGGTSGHFIGANCALDYGDGNINADPLFANSAGGDFHVRSASGRWDPALSDWVLDDGDDYESGNDLNSPCIDAADFSRPYMQELKCNGNRANMGAYGGTSQASRSPGEMCCMLAVPGDLTNDCKVDFKDLALIAQSWMTCNLLPRHHCW